MSLKIVGLDSKDYITGTAEAFNKEIVSCGPGYIRQPGEYTLEITSISLHTEAPSDPNWITVKFTLVDAVGATFNHFQLFPKKRVNDFQYGHKKTYIVFKKLMEFLAAIGISLQFDTAMSTIAMVLSNSDQLLGKTLKCRIGYSKMYIDQNAERKQNKYFINSKGSPLLGPEGEELYFADADAAKNYAKAANIDYEPFPKIRHCYAATDSLLIKDDTVNSELDDFLA